MNASEVAAADVAAAPGQAEATRPARTGNAGSGEALLVATDLVKSYGPVKAVQGVSFVCHPGEVLALVGENGAGKSTVAKMLAGAVTPTSGTITVEDAPLASGSVRLSRRSGVRCAFQELALVPEWTVAENLSLPDGAPLRGFSQKKAISAASALLDSLDLPQIDPRALVSDLSLANRQLVEIARAFAGEPKLLILDEASSALTPPGVEWLFTRIRELTARGGSVIYVSHRLGEIAEIADRGIVLRDGGLAGEFSRGSWTDDELISLMAGRKAERFFPDPPARTREGDVLDVEGLRAEGVHGISLTIGAGEIVGIGGLAGHGQAELLRALFGASAATADSWTIDGDSVTRLTPVRGVRRGLGYVPEDRKKEGLALELGVGENLLAPWFKAWQLGGKPRLARERGWLDGVLAALSVRTRGPLEAAGSLSGGNQQKLVFGRWMNRSRSVILLHDPTRGIDVRAKQELYGAIVDLAKQGVGVLWFSTEVEELVHVCHRVLVLYNGQITDELAGERLTADAIVGAAVGVTGSIQTVSAAELEEAASEAAKTPTRGRAAREKTSRSSR
ncbi:sugar ABC transporter ATP-binding protein [Pseudoclavibacter sp. Z016]|uniref:sugar ABC transporter ATP-binding protein n=1 Tax=Pseudoclavibacter sp. Z016 TaxID=2080581 RepID=UPI000CE8A15E|nr:sugar ABC transporter ATP-binding protein [Pseudoclavibacter sp. Z016]PPF71738.1 sugar ABC transporter ATP-binding protein [Pseudoclavibacter sp. Z016]